MKLHENSLAAHAAEHYTCSRALHMQQSITHAAEHFTRTPTGLNELYRIFVVSNAARSYLTISEQILINKYNRVPQGHMA